MLAECELWDMISVFFPKFWLNVEMAQRFVRGKSVVYKYLVTRAEESGAMWLVVAQFLSNHFPLVRAQN